MSLQTCRSEPDSAFFRRYMEAVWLATFDGDMVNYKEPETRVCTILLENAALLQRFGLQRTVAEQLTLLLPG